MNHDEFSTITPENGRGVSGPWLARKAWSDVIKVKDAAGQCVVGEYQRCCWPCSCDVMKHAMAEEATIRLPMDNSGEEKKYWLLTIGDPCSQCDSMPCNKLPEAVSAFECKDGTSNGI